MRGWKWLFAMGVLAGGLTSCGPKTLTVQEYDKASNSTMQAWFSRVQEISSRPVPDRSLPRKEIMSRAAPDMDDMATATADAVNKLRALQVPAERREINDAYISLLTALEEVSRKDAASLRAGKGFAVPVAEGQLRFAKLYDRLIEAAVRAGIRKEDYEQMRALRRQMVGQ